MEFTQGAPFDSFGLSEATMRAIRNKGYEISTPVQAGCIPPMLAGKDVIAKAPTGTGKTMAFGIPIIERIDPDSEDVQAVILAPTRELAMQITDEMRQIAVCHEGVRLGPARPLGVLGGDDLYVTRQCLLTVGQGFRLVQYVYQMAHLIGGQFSGQGGKLGASPLLPAGAQHAVHPAQQGRRELLRLQGDCALEQSRLQQHQPEHTLFRTGGADVLIPQLPFSGLELGGWGQVLPGLLLFGLPGPVFPVPLHLLGEGGG